MLGASATTQPAESDWYTRMNPSLSPVVLPSPFKSSATNSIRTVAWPSTPLLVLAINMLPGVAWVLSLFSSAVVGNGTVAPFSV